MEKLIIESIRAINERKQTARIHPTHAIDKEVHKEIGTRLKAVTRQMWKDSKIRISRTINNYTFELTDKVTETGTAPPNQPKNEPLSQSTNKPPIN